MPVFGYGNCEDPACGLDAGHCHPEGRPSVAAPPPVGATEPASRWERNGFTRTAHGTWSFGGTRNRPTPTPRNPPQLPVMPAMGLRLSQLSDFTPQQDGNAETEVPNPRNNEARGHRSNSAQANSHTPRVARQSPLAASCTPGSAAERTDRYLSAINRNTGEGVSTARYQPVERSAANDLGETQRRVIDSLARSAPVRPSTLDGAFDGTHVGQRDSTYYSSEGSHTQESSRVNSRDHSRFSSRAQSAEPDLPRQDNIPTLSPLAVSESASSMVQPQQE